jgi:hypothetical protein
MNREIRRTDMPGDKDVILLQRRLDDHINEFHAHVASENERWDHLIDVTERNTESITKLAKSTEGLVDIYRTGNSVIRAGVTMGRFVKWLSSFAVIGYIISWAVEHWPVK